MVRGSSSRIETPEPSEERRSPLTLYTQNTSFAQDLNPCVYDFSQNSRNLGGALACPDDAIDKGPAPELASPDVLKTPIPQEVNIEYTAN
jgi:hypothetical protein